jgi:hypothetical protein
MKVSRYVPVTRVFLLLLLSVFAANSIFAQDSTEADSVWKNKAVISASIQYQNLPDYWHITYYGGSAEFIFDWKLGLSGSIYYGKGSDNRNYIHLPVGGIMAFLIVAGLNQLSESDPVDFWKEFGPLILVENIHYNIPVNDKILISPYVSLFGLDAGIETNSQPGVGLLSYGVGINVNVLLFKRMMVSSFVSVKYFSVSNSDDFGSGSQFGYTANINLGYVFDFD